jgi:membrane dipeptidase
MDPGFGTHDFGLSPADEDRARQLHGESTIVDLIWWGPVGYRSYPEECDAELRAAYERDPASVGSLIWLAQRLPGRLAVAGRFPGFRELWDSSGVTAGHFDVQVGDARQLLLGISHVDYLVDHLPWLRKALRAEDVRTAKREGGHALLLQCQPTTPISRDLGLVDLAYDGGLRMLQLSYNVQDLIAVGCTDSSGGGVSRLGERLISRLDDLGVIVDTSHCNEQTVLDACRISQRPVVVSHAGAAAVHPHDRNISDEAALAIAGTGGVVGVVGHSAFVGGAVPSVDSMLDHIDHLVRVIGWDHVAIGTDWPLAAPKWLLEKRKSMIADNGFRPEHGIDPVLNLDGFDDYRDFPTLTRGMVARGYPDEQIRGILGENFLRVFERVGG